VVSDTDGGVVVGILFGIVCVSTGGGASAKVGVAGGGVAGRSSVGAVSATLGVGSTLGVLGNSSVSVTGSSGV